MYHRYRSVILHSDRCRGERCWPRFVTRAKKIHDYFAIPSSLTSVFLSEAFLTVHHDSPSTTESITGGSPEGMPAQTRSRHPSVYLPNLLNAHGGCACTGWPTPKSCQKNLLLSNNALVTKELFEGLIGAACTHVYSLTTAAYPTTFCLNSTGQVLLRMISW